MAFQYQVSHASHKRIRAWIPYAVLSGALLLTVLSVYAVNHAAESKDRLRFQNAVQETQEGIKAHLETYIALLRATGGLFAGDHVVTRQEFKEYIERLGLPHRYRGIQGIGFSARATPEEKARLTADMRRQGSEEFHIWPEVSQPEYHSIVFLEPLDARNKAAIGYDMFTEPVRRGAMEQARDTGLPSASGKVTLIQELDEHKQAGFLIYVPVYRSGPTPATVEERRAALRGYIFSPFRADDLLEGIFGRLSRPQVDFKVFDGEEAEPEHLLHRSGPDSLTAKEPYTPRFAVVNRIEVVGRQWTLAFTTRPEFELTSGRELTAYILIGGLAISILLFGLARSQATAHEAAERTSRVLQEEIAERKRAEEALRKTHDELEQRVKERTLELELQAQELSRSNAELERFAYVASHDLKEPLRMVTGFTQLLARRYKGKLDDDADEFIGFAVDAAGRMEGLIQDLLTFSRTGSQSREITAVSAETALERAVKNLKTAIEESGAIISYDSLPTVLANQVQLVQLFQNLLGNAIKFRQKDQPPRVEISAGIRESSSPLRTEAERKEWLFTVRDNGIGFDPQYAERIFVVFQRLHTRDEYPGTGVGLAICKKIIESHGGKMWAESQPGKGATFYFTLPATQDTDVDSP
jgi:signal transduction histidine kinase